MKLNIFFFIGLLSLQAQALEVTLPTEQPLFIEYRTRDNPTEVILYLTEKSSGKKTSVQLQRQPRHPQIWYSLSRIRLQEASAQITLTVAAKNQRPLFAHTMSLPNARRPTTSLIIFTQESDLKKFTEQFSKNAERSHPLSPAIYFATASS